MIWKLAESEDHNSSYNSDITSFPKEFKMTQLKLIILAKFLKRNQTWRSLIKINMY